MPAALHRGSGNPGLAPVIGQDAEFLILGSYPSLQSLAKGEYYGNPHNQFWKIMEHLCGIDHTQPYAVRTGQIIRHHIALWDVLATCSREGSADAAIRAPVPNDIRGLLDRYPTVRCIALNGTTAGRCYARLALPEVLSIVLPSTSPAYARLTLAEKTERWAALFRPGLK
jgi:TDG/mug DNA glycosylase family protein